MRQLHEGYLPKCQEMCSRIAQKKGELEAALSLSQGVTPEVEEKLLELATLRSQCQAQMLRHFHEVSLAMPPEQGGRYLTAMEEATLGFHEQFETSMKPQPLMHHGAR